MPKYKEGYATKFSILVYYSGPVWILSEARKMVNAGRKLNVLALFAVVLGAFFALSSILMPSSAAAKRIGKQFNITDRVDPFLYGESRPIGAKLKHGGFVMVWDEVETHAILFSEKAKPKGASFKVNEGSAHDHHVAALKRGGFVIVWVSYDQEEIARVYAQRFSKNGKEIGKRIEVTKDRYTHSGAPRVSGLKNGGFIVVWQDFGQDIFGKVFRRSGKKVGETFLINTTTESWQQAPVVATLKSGDSIVAWLSDGENLLDSFTYGQFVTQNGRLKGGEFRINQKLEDGNYSGGYPEVSALSDGGFAVVWRGLVAFGPDLAIWVRSFNGNGIPRSDQVHVYVGSGSAFGVAGASRRIFSVIWSESRDGNDATIYAQKFTNRGKKKGKDLGLNGNPPANAPSVSTPTVTALRNGRFVAAWESGRLRGQMFK